MDGSISDNASNDTCAEVGHATALTFLITKLIVFVLCVLTSTAVYTVYWLLKRKNHVQVLESRNPEMTTNSKALRRHMRQLNSGDTIPGKILIGVTFFCNLAYLGLAVARSLPPNAVVECVSITDPAVVIELVLTIELVFFAVVRLLASDNIILFWFNPYSLVDAWTLPHIFITITLGMDWLGLRYLRFVWLIHITAILQFVKLVRSQNVADLINLMIYFCALWLACSGILHLIESEGDFWKEERASESHSVLTYLYFLMVTMSTVGYGDVSPVTDLGRTFIIFFILGGLAFFAAVLPAIVEVVAGTYSRAQYSKFDTSRVPKHVILCGHITATTVGEFLKDFLHPDRGDHQTHVLLLHPKRPDEELRNVIRTYYTKVQYLVGSVLIGKDLKKAKIHRSAAVFVLTNKYTSNPTKEDHANLLRVVSVKNTSSSTRCVIQLLRSFSKKQALSLQGWLVGHDLAVCIGELEMGMLAQSCLFPGFSTLVANLFYAVDIKKLVTLDDVKEEPWKKNYVRGLSNELYASSFSDFFKRMTFHQAAQICYKKLGLNLLALEDIKECYFYINPSPNSFPDLQIDLRNMWGYFVAENVSQVSNVSIYCECCPGNKHIGGLKFARELQKQLRVTRMQHALSVRAASTENIMGLPGALSINQVSIGLEGHTTAPAINYEDAAFVGTNLAYDEHASKKSVSFSVREDGTAAGDPSGNEAVERLDLIVPLDKKSRSSEEPAVSRDDGFNETSAHASDGSDDSEDENSDSEDDGDDNELNIDDMLQIHTRDNPVPFDKAILKPRHKRTLMTTVEPSKKLKDHIILCMFADGDSPLLYLYNFLKPLRGKHILRENIKPVVIVCRKAYIKKEWSILSCIPEVYLVLGSPLRWKNLKLAQVTTCSVCVIVTAFPTLSGDEVAVDDKEAILCTLSIQKKLYRLKKKFHVITDLRHESNVQFLDFGDEDTPDERMYKSEPYACGRAFSMSMFDSVTSSIFHNPGLLKLLEGLVNSSSTCKIKGIKISDTKCALNKYSEFYSSQLKEFNVCLGLFRKYPPNPNLSFVITCPDKDLPLEDSDVAIVLTDQ